MVSLLKKHRACAFALACTIIVGLVLTAILYYLAAQNEFNVWRYRATAEAERMTTELLYRMELEREPLLSLATLYNGSESVTDEELETAHNDLYAFTQTRNDMSVAWFNQNTMEFEQVSGNLPWNESNSPPPFVQNILNQTMQNGAHIFTAPIFQLNGESFLAMSVAVSNDEQPGVLVTISRFHNILMRVADDFLDQGKTLSIFSPSNPELNIAQLSPLQTPAEEIHYIENEFAGNPLSFRWSLDADHSPLWEDSHIGTFVIIVGLAITFLAAFAYGSVLFQNIRVEELVEERTKQLKATYEGLQSVQTQLIKQDRLASLGKLVAGVSHELSTPVSNAHMAANVLSDSVGILENSEKLTAKTLAKEIQKLKEASNLINSSTQRATDLITSFKDVSVENTSTRLSEVSLRNIVNEVISTMSSEIEARQLDVENLVDSEIKVETFSGQLAMVVAHLLRNSIIHAYHSGTKGKVTIQSEETASQDVVILIRDYGVGMEKDVLDRIFEPFFTTKLGQGGSGLGMHIVYNSVDAVLGGKVRVESATHEGTTFILKLPMKAPCPHAVKNIQLDN